MKLKPLLLICLTLTIPLLESHQSFAQKTLTPKPLLQRRSLFQNNRAAIAQLEEVKGKVSIKRSGSAEYIPLQSTNEKTTLFWGDLLKVERNARAVVRCYSNSVKWIVPDDGVPRGVATICS